jgi:hypothetical protein
MVIICTTYWNLPTQFPSDEQLVLYKIINLAVCDVKSKCYVRQQINFKYPVAKRHASENDRVVCIP